MDQNHKLICTTLKHDLHPQEIGGIKFIPENGDMVATNVPGEQAKRFVGMYGYEVIPPIRTPSEKPGGSDDGKGKGAGPDGGELKPKALKDWSVKALIALIEKEPSRWNEVLTSEEGRDQPRQSVLEAVRAAKTAFEQTGVAPVSVDEKPQTPAGSAEGASGAVGAGGGDGTEGTGEGTGGSDPAPGENGSQE